MNIISRWLHTIQGGRYKRLPGPPLPTAQDRFLVQAVRVTHGRVPTREEWAKFPKEHLYRQELTVAVEAFSDDDEDDSIFFDSDASSE